MLTHFLALSAEQLALFLGFVAECPGAAAVAWESVAIDVIGAKRVLCLQAPWQPGMQEPIYAHYFPDGLTEDEMRTITDQHGLPEFSTLDDSIPPSEPDPGDDPVTGKETNRG